MVRATQSEILDHSVEKAHVWTDERGAGMDREGW